jgi:exodeoxyribonuclease VII large subunit
MTPITCTPTDFVALLNQTMEYALPSVVITGELANFRVSKGRWVYFDLKDEFSSVKFFGTIYNLPGPLEEGMVLEVTATPRLHNLYGFSCNVQSIRLSGEGTIKKASELLLAQLTVEGLFAPERKRTLPYPPETIGLITSGESAAYADFVKVLGARYGGLDIQLADVQVQGEPAPGQIVRAIQWFNRQSELPDVLVIIRGGGSADDLQAFSTEQVVRAVAASRIPTLVAIGHEVDTSLAELAADLRASTPSNAAELLVPDRKDMLKHLQNTNLQLLNGVQNVFISASDQLVLAADDMRRVITDSIDDTRQKLSYTRRTLDALDPRAVLKRGFALVRDDTGALVRSVTALKPGTSIGIQLADGTVKGTVQ